MPVILEVKEAPVILQVKEAPVILEVKKFSSLNVLRCQTREVTRRSTTHSLSIADSKCAAIRLMLALVAVDLKLALVRLKLLATGANST